MSALHDWLTITWIPKLKSLCYPKRENYLLGRIAVVAGSGFARRHFGASKGRVQYHKKKLLDGWKNLILINFLDFHSLPHGGNLYSASRFSDPQTKLRLSAFLWWQCQRKPTTKLKEYCRKVQQFLNLKVSVTTIRRIFRSWRWTFKKPDYKQIQKYSNENISYYFRSWWFNKFDLNFPGLLYGFVILI